LTSAGDFDSFIRKFTPDGAEVWTRQFGTAQSDGIYASWADGSGVYVTGFVNLAWPGQTSAGLNDTFVRKYSPAGVELWTRQFGSTLGEQGRTLTGYASAIYVGGQTSGAFPGQTSALAVDAYLVKFTTGGDQVWTRQFGFPGPSQDEVLGIASDGVGSVYVTGLTNGELPGEQALGPWGATDVYLRRYTSAGTLLWTRTIGTAASDTGMCVAADSTGVYLCGMTSDALPGQAWAGLTDAFVQKYDPHGNLVWTNQFGSPTDDRFTGIALDPSGIYLSGYTRGALPGQTLSGSYDAFVRKYTYAGTPIWTRQFGTVGFDNGFGVAAGLGGVYVAGNVTGILPGQPYSGQGDAFVRKYDQEGTEMWTRVFGSAFSDEARGVALDSSGIYLAGTTAGVLDDPALPLTNAGASDIFLRKYGHDGTHIWTRQFGSALNDSARGIAAYGSAVHVAGAAGPLPGLPFGGGVTDGVVRSYDRSGTLLWTTAVATPLADSISAVAADGTGVYLGGATQGTLSGQTGAGGTDAFVVKLDTTPPSIQSVVPSPAVIWPPNNMLTPVTVAVAASDAGTPSPACQIASVSSNEPGNGQWAVTGPLQLNLLASRNSNGNGRIYTITVRCSDASGNAASASTTVTVPHDQGRN
jgi:hypothetical protein